MTDYTDNNRETSAKHGAENSDQGKHSPSVVEKFVIRLPKGLRNKIKHLSEQNRRSMNSEIIMVLEKHIQQNMMTESGDFDLSLPGNTVFDNGDLQSSAISELTRRLENLPEEKKQALLELLG